jgi:hypothetical protein
MLGFHQSDGDMLKAAHAIDEALKPELERSNACISCEVNLLPVGQDISRPVCL